MRATSLPVYGSAENQMRWRSRDSASISACTTLRVYPSPRRSLFRGMASDPGTVDTLGMDKNSLNLDTRAGRMLAAGRLTVTFRSPSGQHITLTAKCRAPQENGKWSASSYADARVIFIEVPNETGWNDKVGKVTSRGFQPDPNADKARTFCAKMLLRYVAGESLPPSLEAFEEDRCGRCGRVLTDPVSIERGIGPECYGKDTGSEHQTKERDENWVAKLNGNPLPTAGTSQEVTPEMLAERNADSTATDKAGVPLAVGGWRERKRYLDAELKTERRETSAERAAKPCNQQRELPGTTWEDIFGGTDSIAAEGAAHQARRDARLAARM